MVKIFKVPESLTESCHFGGFENIVMATSGYKHKRTESRTRICAKQHFSQFPLLEATQVAIEGCMNKQTVGYTQKGV